jgi:hypothetical protein
VLHVKRLLLPTFGTELRDRRWGRLREIEPDFRTRRASASNLYGLIAAGISVAIITVVGTLSTSLNTTFTSVATALK